MSGPPRPVDPEEEAPLLDISAYLERVLLAVEPLPAQTVLLEDAFGLVLAEEIKATTDMPPFISSAMDGYAVRSADVASAGSADPVRLKIIGEVRMGTVPAVVVGPGEAAIVPTGGIVPEGADAVVPVELTAIPAGGEGETVAVLRAVPSSKHVRPSGEDARIGDVITPAGRRLAAPDLGAIAAAGHPAVRAFPPAVVGIVSTGDEIVRPPRKLEPGSIYDANFYTLTGACQAAGAIPFDGGCIGDDPQGLLSRLEEISFDVDLFVCSGGVSMGERDPVKLAFSSGAKGSISFFNVAMQPGRPQAFGSFDGKPFFGLPGNPVSVFTSFQVFVRPALAKMTSSDDRTIVVSARLAGSLQAPRTRTRFARVKVHLDGDTYIATPIGGHQSNLLASFAAADGLAVVAPGSAVAEGDLCEVRLFRDVPVSGHT